jgi:hypothetical protein
LLNIFNNNLIYHFKTGKIKKCTYPPTYYTLQILSNSYLKGFIKPETRREREREREFWLQLKTTITFTNEDEIDDDNEGG